MSTTKRNNSRHFSQLRAGLEFGSNYITGATVDVHAQGARIQATNIPQDLKEDSIGILILDLAAGARVELDCRLCWTTQDEIGVAFVEQKTVSLKQLLYGEAEELAD